MADEALNGLRCSLLMNAGYHASREAFLDTVHRWFMFLVIALGAAALVDLLQDGHPWLKGAFSACAALIAALDLTFDLSNRARAHSMMKRRYFELLADFVEGRKPLEEVRACLDRFSADEEPVYRVLFLACWNNAQKSVYGHEAQHFEISWCAMLFKNFFRRPGATFKVKKNQAAGSQAAQSV